MFGKKKGKRKFIDVHCHILPGLDDGSQDMDTTIKMLKIAAKDGISEFIVTPHYKNGRKNASIKTIKERIAAVEKEAKKHGLEVALYPGHEVFNFGEITEGIEAGEILTMNETDCVLIEFMPGQKYSTIRNVLDYVSGEGYQPIVAHVERYECLVKDWKRVEELKQIGCEIQINASTVLGALGGPAKKFVHKLLSKELVDYVGTDAHDAKKRTPQIQKCMNVLYRKYDTDYVDAILYENALNLVEAE